MAAGDNERVPRFPEEDLKARAAWHYYVEGLTQEQISELLGIGRIKVHRMLSAARDEGVIQFRVRGEVSACIQLEKSLKERFGLRDVVVVPAAADGAQTPEVIGHAASSYIADNINAGDVIAVGWGRTIKFAIDALPQRAIPHSVVVSMMGGLTHAQPLNPTESAWQLAEAIGGDCFLLPVPVYADLPAHREAFMSQRAVQDVVLRARRASLAVLSVGTLSNDSPIANYGYIKPSELDELRAAGAVGDILCHFIDADGKPVDHAVNRRVCAFPIEQLGDMHNMMLVSGGREKVDVMKAALTGLNISVLITDESAAKGLLA